VQAEKLPRDLPGGPWQIIRVFHRLTATEGGTTLFEARIAGSQSGSLLAAALSAVGSLL